MNVGRCYCGACTISASDVALTVAYCHCGDCRRWTGAAVPGFAAFGALQTNGPVKTKVHRSGVERANCADCGSPLTSVFPYLAGHIYVPLGVLDNIDAYPPQMHCHSASKPSWLHIQDDLPREDQSARTRLGEAGNG